MKNVLANLSLKQKISIGLVALAVVIGIYSLIRHQREAGFKPLFTGLSPEDAASIVQKLKEAGVDYRLPEGGGSVLVPAGKLAELRLNMAAVGLPKTGRIGFELFDKTNLGATEFSEHINYRRALEGELERSIGSLSEVEQARVHLTFSKDSVFLESQEPAKASVMVKIKPGAKLTPRNILAINHLVSSAVEGLSPDAVSVLDMNGNLLGRPKAGSLDGPEPSEAVLDYRRRIESDLMAKVNSTLEALLGANKFRAGVSIECDYANGEQSEEIFDPTRSVMVSSQRSEDSSGGASPSGVPGTASSLPNPPSRPAGSRSLARMTENITYQTSRTVKKTRIPAGGIRKMSLAVLVDQQLTWERENNGFKRVLAPPTPEKLKAIRELVAGVTGFDAARGDQLVVESLPFESTLQLEPPPLPPAPTPAAPSGMWRMPNLKIFAIVIASVLLALLVWFAVIRFRRKPAATAAAAVEIQGPEAPELPAIAAAGDPLEATLAERDALQQKLETEALAALRAAPAITKTAEVLARHLRERIAKDPAATAQILRTWIREEEAMQ